MSKVKEAHLEGREERDWHGGTIGRMPKKRGRKKQPETQIDGQMELVPNKDNQLTVKETKKVTVTPVKNRTRETQLKWNAEAKRYYLLFENMIDSYGAYIQMLRPWQDIKKNGLKSASSGSLGMLNDYFKGSYDKMTKCVVDRGNELKDAIAKFSKQALRFGINYPTDADEDLKSREIRQKYRGYINTKKAELEREAEKLQTHGAALKPEKAITKVLAPSDMRAKYVYHRRKNK